MNANEFVSGSSWRTPYFFKLVVRPYLLTGETSSQVTPPKFIVYQLARKVPEEGIETERPAKNEPKAEWSEDGQGGQGSKTEFACHTQTET